MKKNIKILDYGVGNLSYWQMMNNQKSQSILVSGESGAGKTETTKLCLQYISFVAAGRPFDHSAIP